MSDKPDSLFRATCNGASLIASGTLIPLPDAPIDISVPIGSGALTLSITLEEDKNDRSSRSLLRGGTEDKNIIYLRLVNVNSFLGGGPTKPIPLWRSDTSEIVLMLRIYTQDEYPPVIHFSFFSKPIPAQKPTGGTK